MSEQRAGRGEGLAGLADRISERVAALLDPQQLATLGKGGRVPSSTLRYNVRKAKLGVAQIVKEELAALEAAARLPAPPDVETLARAGHRYWRENKWLDQPLNRKAWLQATPEFDGMNGSAREMFLTFTQGIVAALATPPPQAPQSRARCEILLPGCGQCELVQGHIGHHENGDFVMGAAATQEQPAGSGASKGGSMSETKEQYEARMLMPDLCLRGKATDHIWLMEDVEGYIGIRMDCGDSGTVYLTHEQARDLAQQVMSLQPGSPRKVGEDGARLRTALERAGFLVHRELCGNLAHHPECRLITNALKGHAENCNSVLFDGPMGECDCALRPSSAPVGEQK